MGISKEVFGKTEDATAVNMYTLTNANGLVAKITNYGGIITSLKVPDRDGNLADIVLGYESLDKCLKSGNYFGTLVGRFANRISDARFTLD